MSTNKHTLRVPAIIAGLCLLKVLWPYLYRRAQVGTLTFEEINSVLRFTEWRDQHDDGRRARASETAEDIWRYLLGAELDDETTENIARIFYQYDIEKERIAPVLAQFIDGLAFPSDQ